MKVTDGNQRKFTEAQNIALGQLLNALMKLDILAAEDSDFNVSLAGIFQESIPETIIRVISLGEEWKGK